jgi:uncharacterized membrane protein YbhN (UPF0104 family)
MTNDRREIRRNKRIVDSIARATDAFGRLVTPRGRAAALARLAVPMLFLGGFAAWTVYYVRGHADEFQVLRQVASGDMISLYAAFGLILVCNGAFFRLSVAAFDVDLRRAEALALSVVGSFTNLFLPLRAGAGLRALYLSRQHNLGLAEFLAGLGLLYLMHAVVSGGVGLAGLALLASGGAPVHLPVAAFFTAAMFAGLAAMRVEYKGPSTPPSGFPRAQLHSLLAGWARARRRARIVGWLWGVAALFTLASLWQVHAAFRAISVDLSLGGILVYTGSKNLTALASLTPAALGIVEAASIYLGGVLGYTTAQALLAQGLIRFVSISSLLALGPIAFLVLRRRVAAAKPNGGDADARASVQP